MGFSLKFRSVPCGTHGLAISEVAGFRTYSEPYPYISTADIASEPKSPLFRTVDRSRALTVNRMHRNDVLGMIKRRARRVGISEKISPHTFRATGITIYLDEGGDLETAQAIAAHESPRATKLYDRTSDAIDLAEIERIRV